MRESFFTAAPVALVDGLALGSLAVVVATLLVLIRDWRLRARSLTGIVVGAGWMLVAGMAEGKSGRHILALFIDVMVLLAVMLGGLRSQIREAAMREARGEPRVETESDRRKATRIAWLAMGGFAVLLTLEYLPIWPA